MVSIAITSPKSVLETTILPRCVRRQLWAGATQGPLSDIYQHTATVTSRHERLALFGLVPGVLTAIALLPAGVTGSWILHVNAPSAQAVYLTNFVHSGWTHLAINAATYLVFMSTLLAVAVYAEIRHSLFAVTTVYIVVVPGIVSGYTLWLVSESGVNTVVGFSGVNAALLGYIPVLLFRFFHETVNAEIRPHHALGIVAVVLAVIFSMWSGVRGLTILLGGLGVVGVCLTWWLGRSEWGTITTSTPRAMLVWSATIVFLGGSYGMFVNTSPSTNIYGHLSGFVAGVAIPTLGSILMTGYQSVIGFAE